MSSHVSFSFKANDLPEEIIRQTRGPETKEFRSQPIISKGLLHHRQLMQGGLCSTDSTGGLHSDSNSGCKPVIANGFEHHKDRRHGCSRCDLAC